MKKGFTLIELLAVIAILGILVLIVLPNIVESFNKSKEDTFLVEVRSIYSAAKRQWVMDSVKGLVERTYGKCDGCSYQQLELSGRDELKYKITINQEGNVTIYDASDGTFSYSYRGEGLQLNEIKQASTGIITISDEYFDDKMCFFMPNEDFTTYEKQYVPFHNGMTWGQFFNYTTTNNVSGFIYVIDSVWDSNYNEHLPSDPDFNTYLNNPNSHVYYTLSYKDYLLTYINIYNGGTRKDYETIDAFGTSLTDWYYFNMNSSLNEQIKNHTQGCYGQGWG